MASSYDIQTFLLDKVNIHDTITRMVRFTPYTRHL